MLAVLIIICTSNARKGLTISKMPRWDTIWTKLGQLHMTHYSSFYYNPVCINKKPIHPDELLWGQTLLLDERVWLSATIHSKGDQYQSNSSIANSSNRAIIDLALITSKRAFSKLKHVDFASLKLKRRLLGSSPQHFPPKFNWHSGERQVMFSWHFKNSDSSIKLPGREVVTPQDMFPLLQSPVETCFTPLHSKLVSLLGDVRLEGSYSDIKSHATPGSQFLCWC